MSADAGIVIRRARPDDARALGRLGAELVRIHHAFDADRFFMPEWNLEEGYGRFLSSQLESEKVVVFVAERAGEVVGYVYGGIEPRELKELRDVAGFIHDVMVVESARDTGAGERLVEAASEWLLARGMARVMLWTAEKNTGAQRLFERLGFRRTMIEMTRSGR